MRNQQFYGDCLDVLRELADDRDFTGVDLICHDPSFDLKRVYSSAGLYESPFKSYKYPKIQILTVEGLMKGTQRPEYPDFSGGQTFKKAKKEVKDESKKQTGMFDEDDDTEGDE